MDGGGDDVDHLVDVGVGHDHLDPHLRHEVDGVLGAPEGLGLAALAVLGALLAIDCLSLVGAATWSDPARSPHLGAVHQARHRGVVDSQRSPLTEPGDLPPAAALVAAVLVVVMVAVATRRPALVQDRSRRSRGPPSLRFAGVRL